MTTIVGTNGDDFIHAAGDGQTPPDGANDIPEATDLSDVIDPGRGDDTVFGLGGNDILDYRLFDDGADDIVLGDGSDVVKVRSADPAQVRLTFTSSEVGNGNVNDAGTLANQDGGRAVRLRGEDGADGLTGPLTRTDDEGITFVAGRNVTFDVRDLVSGIQRGDAFKVVQLGTAAGDSLAALLAGKSYYINAGGGDDTVTGGGRADFLVGGAGNDRLRGGEGPDSLLGGAGNDTLRGASGNDTAIFNVTTDGADEIRLGDGEDIVSVAAGAATQVRLTFTSVEVGNDDGSDSNTMANQDGGFAVRLQAENGSDVLTGPVTRVDDEGITFAAGAGVTFDVRDLVSGVQRGDQFQFVVLGTAASEVIAPGTAAVNYYVNAGMGDDTVRGGAGNDVLVGGAGTDVLFGGTGNDTFIVDAFDTLREGADDGIDTVQTAAARSLTANIENLTLTGTAAVAGTGNGIGNVIVGNVAANALDGANGADTLTGGTGDDDFIFSTRLREDDADTITDFVSGTDDLVLDSRVFRGLEAGALDAEAFTTDPQSLEEDDRIVYDAASGTLSFDRDGAGGRFALVAFASLGSGTALVADDLTIV